MARQRQKKGRLISGWIILDKPLDYGSTEAVSKLKWLFKAQKAGHAGTLDPLASGMLPIAFGEATKTVPYVMDGRKIYHFTVTWGQERRTDDSEGEVVRSSKQRPAAEEINALLQDFTGTISQVPPQFSAIKIDGARAYDLARDGEELELRSREVIVHRLTLLSASKDTAKFEVECGKGTYVRAIARDMGRALGCFGYVSELRRTAVMPFGEDQMVPLSDITDLESIEADEDRWARLDNFLVDAGEALSHLPELSISDQQAVRIKSGNPILLRGAAAPLDEEEICAKHNGKVIALGEVTSGEFRPKRVFNW